MQVPLYFGLEQAGLPLILTTENPKNLCFLIDTGSSNNVIFDFVYNHFKNYFTNTSDTQNIFGIDGNMKAAFIVNADLQFDDLRYRAPFAVLEAKEAIIQVQTETCIQIHGVLGIPFLIENQCVIDFNKLIIKSDER